MEDDFKLLEHYQKFSAELLRLSLLGITALAYLKFNHQTFVEGSFTGGVFVFGIGFFGLASSFALAHRYYSSDSMACLLKRTRLKALVPTTPGLVIKVEKENQQLRKQLKRSAASIWCASLSFFLAIVALGVIFL